MALGPKNIKKPINPFFYLVILALLGAGISLIFHPEKVSKDPKNTEKIALSEFLAKYEKDEFKSIEIKDQKITAESFDQNWFETVKEPGATTADLGLNKSNIRAKIEIADTSGRKMWTSLLIGLAPFVLLILLLIFISRRAGQMGGENGPFGFGKSKAKIYDKKKAHYQICRSSGRGRSQIRSF